MEADLRTFLLADARVTDLVVDRVAWNARPRGEGLAALCLHKISGTPKYIMRGRTSLSESLVQIDCWASTAAEARALADAVIVAFDPPLTPPIMGGFIVRDRSDYTAGDGPRPDGAKDFHRTSLDIRVWHKPT